MQYRLRASNAHDLHSPFVYALYTQIIRKPDQRLAERLKQLRKRMVKDNTTLTISDPRTGQTTTEPFKKRARRISSTHQFSLFLTQLINHQGYSRVLETGTGAGINLAYLSQSSAQNIRSLEGSATLAAHVEQKLRSLSISNCSIEIGKVQDTFIPALQHLQPDMVFLDADHRSETIRFYLDAIATHAPQVQCIVIHDIYWSADMHQAWQQVIQNPAYALTIDIFQAGLLFPHHPMSKQHFQLKF